MILKGIFFILAVLNLIGITIAVYLNKKNLSLALGILEIVLVFIAGTL